MQHVVQENKSMDTKAFGASMAHTPTQIERRRDLVWKRRRSNGGKGLEIMVVHDAVQISISFEWISVRCFDFWAPEANMHLENQQMPLLVHFRVLYLTLGYTGIHWDTLGYLLYLTLDTGGSQRRWEGLVGSDFPRSWHDYFPDSFQLKSRKASKSVSITIKIVAEEAGNIKSWTSLTYVGTLWALVFAWLDQTA